MTRSLPLAALLALAAPRAALASDIGSTLVSIGVPAIIFLSVVAIVATVTYARHREAKERQQTLRLAIEKGVPVPPELVEVSASEPRPARDLRSGILQLFIGLGVGVLLYFVAPYRNTWAVGVMIAIFGLGHIVAWAVTRRGAAPPPA
jgi:membrane protein YdbS with pleckstrin-like domain